MQKLTVILFLSIIIAFTACENPVQQETVVNADESLDKTITFEKADSILISKNIFGVSGATGWKTKIRLTQDTNRKEKIESNKNYQISFEKHFNNTEEINHELDKPIDSLFRIQSNFKKEFRWFYSYIKYSEVWRPIDRLKLVKSSDYITKEDQDFIKRLPGEGTILSKTDSAFLKRLNEKIFDQYAITGLFEECFSIMQNIAQRNSADQNLLTNLINNKQHVRNRFNGSGNDKFLIRNILDSLGFKISAEKYKRDSIELSRDFNSRLAFMTFAQDGQYINVITMPWCIAKSNADSTVGNKLFWKPLPTKFAISDYEMYAEAEQFNWWALFVSIFGVAIIIWLLARSFKIKQTR